MTARDHTQNYTNLTDAIAARRVWRPRTTDVREVLNALLYIALTGCQWRMVPKDSPTAGVIDSQSVKTTDSVGLRGFDAEKNSTNASVTLWSTRSA